MYKKIIIETFDSIFKNSSALMQRLIIPTIIITIINYFIPQFISQELINNINIQTIDPKAMFILIAIGFILTMINISIAITTHRVSILGKDSVPKFGSLIFGLREFKFLFKTILFGIIIGLISFLIALIPIVGIFILPVVLVLLISRLALVFPAVACDEKMGFLQAWRNTKSFKLLTILMIIIFPILFSFLVGIIYSLAIEFLIKIVSPHMMILYSILNVFIMVFTISALSSVYKHIKPTPFNKPLKQDIKPLRETIQSSRKGVHKIIIDDRNNVNFELLKKELSEQFSKLGFTEVVYERKNSWLVKNKDDTEAYVSLRHDGSDYTIQAKDTKEPVLNIIKKLNK